MMLFYNNAAKHLAQKVRIKKGNFTIKRFSDGEIHVKIQSDVRKKKVWVLANTNPPAENMLELVFLIDALKRSGAKIKLLIPYFGYARQSHEHRGEAYSSKLVCGWFRGLDKVVVIHMHSPVLKKFLNYEDIVPFDIFPVGRFDLIVAPDKGALKNAKKLSKSLDLPLGCMEKIRPEKEKVKIVKVVAEARGKNVLIIDDMITTGNTVIKAAAQLKGAKEISVAATHGIFSDDALKKIGKSPIKMVYVTNSLPQKAHRKLKTINLAPLLENIIKNG